MAMADDLSMVKPKLKKNAYVCFVMERKREEEEKGAKLPVNLRDLISIFGEEWAGMNDQQRAPYKAMSSGSKCPGTSRNSVPSNSRPSLYEHDWMKKKMGPDLTVGEFYTGKVNVTHRKRDTQNDLNFFVDVNEGDPREHVFILIHFNIYSDFDDIIPAEVGLAAFSLKRGLIDNYSTLIDPGCLPRGSAAEARDYIIKYGLPEPPFAHSCRNYKDIMDNIEKFIQQYPTLKRRKTYMFCLRDQMEQITRSLNWLCEKIGVVKTYHLHSFSMLIQNLANFGRQQYIEEKSKYLPSGETLKLGDPIGINSGRFMARRIPHTTAHELTQMRISSPSFSVGNQMKGILQPQPQAQPPEKDNDVHPKEKPKSMKELGLHIDSDVFMFERLAEEFLHSQDMAYYPELGCPHHMVNNEQVSNCSLSIVNRYIYNSLDILVEYWGIQPIEGYHYPLKSSDMEMVKRRKLLAMRGIHGYAGLKGFEDSRDYRYDPDIISSCSASTYNEFDGFNSKSENKVGQLHSSMSSSSLYNISDIEADAEGAPPELNLLDNDNENFNIRRRDNPSQKWWTLKKFQNEDCPTVVFQPSFLPGSKNWNRNQPGSSSLFKTSNRTVEELPSSSQFHNDNGVEYNQYNNQFISGKSLSTNNFSDVPYIPDPQTKVTFPNGYPHYFDPMLRTYGRGVRCPMSDETPNEFHKRQLNLRLLRQKTEKFYPTNDL